MKENQITICRKEWYLMRKKIYSETFQNNSIYNISYKYCHTNHSKLVSVKKYRYLIRISALEYLKLEVYMTEISGKPDTEILLKRLPEADGLDKIQILADLAVAFLEIDSEKVIKFGKQGLELLQSTEDKKLETVILNELCWAYYCIGEYQTALDYGFRELSITDETGDDASKSTALNRIGAIYLKTSRFDQALDYFLQALKIREDIGDKLGIATLLNNIGIIFRRTGNNKKALNYYNRAIRTLKKIDDKSNLAISYNNAGGIYGDFGEFEKALEYHEKALEIREQLGEKRRISHSFINIGSVLQNLKEYDRSLKYYFRALEIEKETGDRYATAETLGRIGIIYALTDQFTDALEYVQQGLTITEELHMPDVRMYCFERMSTIFEKKGDFRKALEYHKQFKKVNDEIFTEESSKKYNELQVSYETEKKERESEIYRLKNIELVKANEKLTKALAEVKTLSGLLPICSSCKKIRDDSGYWAQIEEYITERSDTQFSHGICPECLKKLYPEYSVNND